jgi:hypothetical protein
MFSLIHDQIAELKELISHVQQGRRGTSPISYARALQLIYATLRHTQKEIESIYFSYVLRPTLQTENATRDPIALSCLYMMAKLARKTCA